MGILSSIIIKIFRNAFPPSLFQTVVAAFTGESLKTCAFNYNILCVFQNNLCSVILFSER